MTLQIEVDEMNGCPGYFDWLMKVISGDCSGEDKGNTVTGKDICANSINKTGYDICADGAPLRQICRIMFETDFICCLGTEQTIKEDEIRAKDAMELRRRYAESVGADAGKSEREIDRIWKSIHGNCSVLELILSICYRLDAMVNEEEPGTMVGMFFRILIGNLGFDLKKKEIQKEQISVIIDRFLRREYGSDGTGGGLFPIKKWDSESSKDMRELSIWYQMNAWLNEHLDEEEHFVK